MRAKNEIELVTLFGTFTGAATAVFPNLAFVAQKVFDWPVWITAIQFSTTLTVYPTDSGGMLLTLGKQSQNGLAVDTGLQSVIAHITAPNSLAGPPALGVPSSKVSNITFGDCGYYLTDQTPLSLYAFANTTASGNFLFAIASVQYRRAND